MTQRISVFQVINVISTVSDSTLQLAFKKLPLVEFWYSTKEDHSCVKKASKIFVSFQMTYLCRVFLTSFNQNNTLQQCGMGAIMRIQLSSVKPDVKEICKNVKRWPFVINFLFLKYSYFSSLHYRINTY